MLMPKAAPITGIFGTAAGITSQIQLINATVSFINNLLNSFNVEIM